MTINKQLRLENEALKKELERLVAIKPKNNSKDQQLTIDLHDKKIDDLYDKLQELNEWAKETAVKIVDLTPYGGDSMGKGHDREFRNEVRYYIILFILLANTAAIIVFR